MTDFISDQLAIDTPASDISSDAFQQTASALTGYLSTLVPTASSDQLETLNQISSSVLQHIGTLVTSSDNISTANTILPSDSFSASISDTINGSDNGLNKAIDSFVNHVGETIVSGNISDKDVTQLLMQDVSQIWQNKQSFDTLATSTASVWKSVRESPHFPVITGAIAAFLFGKKK